MQHYQRRQTSAATGNLISIQRQRRCSSILHCTELRSRLFYHQEYSRLQESNFASAGDDSCEVYEIIRKVSSSKTSRVFPKPGGLVFRITSDTELPKYPAFHNAFRSGCRASCCDWRLLRQSVHRRGPFRGFGAICAATIRLLWQFLL